MRPRHSLLLVGLLALPLISTGSARADIVTNGTFDSGDLSGFTVYTTASGTNGPSGLPNVVSFNVTGSGASNAAHFNVGETALFGTQQGGGLLQSIFVATSGLYTFSENFASQVTSSNANADGGTFSLLLNGSTIASQSLGGVAAGAISRGTLTNTRFLTMGTYTLQSQITRTFFAGGPGVTPDEYVDNISVVSAATPEPSSLLLFATGAAAVLGRARRRFRIAF